MSFKIADTFYGASGGHLSFFGVHEEDRDHRRFDTYDEAERALEIDELNARDEPAPSTVPRPLIDRWGRRFMNLKVVPSDFHWCLRAGDDRWCWQKPHDFHFDGPVSQDRLRYAVALGARPLGRIETDSTRPRSWTAERKGSSIGQFTSAYEAACALLELIDDPPKPKGRPKGKSRR